MSIKQLTSLIPPPKSALDNQGNWRSAEIILGIGYPITFQDLISRYGSGAFFRGHLTVYNPLTLEGLANIKQMERICLQLRDGLYPLPLPVHPESPGLLPWGGDENGNTYCWFTKGKPDKWPVIFLGRGSASHPIQFKVGIVDFLLGYAKDQFSTLVQPDNPMTEEMRIFTPGRNQNEIARKLVKLQKKK
jgi:hypothetical protein